ncbi:hypothetical protein [Mucilaginibacter terrigena]|uniref:hypothetical protein n=1 Tax=Mucilaginibacter terrigena TaxID=2492395 RepID=UPI001396BE6F|nr:hypothetical protein [Mucilaginibacter terrigena]
MTTSQKKPAAAKKTTRSSSTGNTELKTDLPMSEKDEVKKAEDRTSKGAKK